MKQLFLMLVAASLLSSCTKSSNSNTPDPETKKYDVTFAVSDFGQTVGNLNAKGTKQTLGVGDTLKNYADNLYYRIYNTAGELVNSIDQASTLASFGTVSDKLPAGTYTAFFAASKGSLYAASLQSTYSSAFYSPVGRWNDTFTKVIQLTVGTSEVTQAVMLDRAIGGLQVVLTDAIPSNAAKIAITYQSETTFLYFNSANTISKNDALTNDYPLTSADIGVKNKTFVSYVANTSGTSSVIIRAYDSSNGLITEKTIPNVRVYKNQKTTLSGALFPSTPITSTPSTLPGFTGTVNPTWDTPTASTIPFSL